MVTGSHPKKLRVDLSDYDSHRDIENRLLISRLNTFDIEVLQEIVYNSLTFPVQTLAKNLDADLADLEETLEKLSCSGLFQREGNRLHVDKEIRKYFELYVEKFDEDFTPGIAYLQELLNHVPIHVLPQWYLIPRTSNNIFDSIVENYLQTPRIYQRYLSDLQFDEPILNEITKELFQQPDLTLTSPELLKKFQIDQETLERLLLILELNFVCCVSYRMENDQWTQIVTPLQEWHDLLAHEKKACPKTLCDPDELSRCHPHDFGFIQDISELVKCSKQHAISIQDKQEAGRYLPHIEENPCPDLYLSMLQEILLSFQLCMGATDGMRQGPAAEEWLAKPIQEQAMTLYRYNKLEGSSSEACVDKNMREMEKALRKVFHSHWIPIDGFIESLTIAIGNVQPVTLENKGKRWRYRLPEYTQEEKDLALKILMRFFQAGMISTGRWRDAYYFTVTPFGRMTIGE